MAKRGQESDSRGVSKKQALTYIHEDIKLKLKREKVDLKDHMNRHEN